MHRMCADGSITMRAATWCAAAAPVPHDQQSRCSKLPPNLHLSSRTRSAVALERARRMVTATHEMRSPCISAQVLRASLLFSDTAQDRCNS